LNRLAGYDRAIVTDVPGTTRDTVEVQIQVDGMPFRLVDTAGVRSSDDPIERMGIERSREAMEQADLILLVRDATVPPTAEDESLLQEALDRADTILVWNKSDLPAPPPPAPERAGERLTTVSLSAKTGAGLDKLEQAMGRLGRKFFPQTQAEHYGVLLANQRQTQAAQRALDSVRRAREALQAGVTPDALLTDVEEALSALGELTGQSVREDVTDRIFSKFCVGK
jgi:tRNA modification GTPase